MMYFGKAYSFNLVPLFITMVGICCGHCVDVEDPLLEDVVTNCGELSVEGDVVGEKTCGGGSSLLCLILH